MYINSGINSSPTIAEKAGAALNNAACLAAKYDGNGNVVLTGAGNHAVGILIPETPDAVAQGDTLTLQVKDIGYWKAGATFTKGTELTPDANGKAVAAAAGNFILAVALEEATAADQIIKVQIIKAGYKPA